MISVCMATYNGEQFIKKQINSILCQLSAEDELVISDDGSTDATLQIIESFNDKRIKVFNHVKNSVIVNGQSKYKNFLLAKENFENAISLASGEYIFLSDQDDIWLPGKVKKTLELFKKYDCVIHNYQIIDIFDNVRKTAEFTKNPVHKTVLMNVIDNHFRGCCLAFKTEFLNKILPIPEKVIGHDYWIGSIMAHYGKVHYELEPLIQSRWYLGSVSGMRKTSIFYKIEHRTILLFSLLKRITKI